MSLAAGRIERALTRLCEANAVLAPTTRGVGFGVYAGGDRRRRPCARLNAEEVEALASEGAIEGDSSGYKVTAAGRARARRDAALPDEAWLAQHAPIEARTVMAGDGRERCVRAVAPSLALRRLAALRDGVGAPWLTADEIEAAARLYDDWRAGQAGLIGASDWTAPPRGGAAHGPGNAREAALARTCDARRRVELALAAMAAPLRRVVESVCLRESGIEALERQEGWPARSGKLALKLGLAQLAAGPVYGRG